MPTITLQVGQAGNQLGGTFWGQLQQQQELCSSSLLSHEWFASTQGQAVLQPRCICVDSEAKVVQQWRQTDRQTVKDQPAVHVLGRGGGCGNNWWEWRLWCRLAHMQAAGSLCCTPQTQLWLAHSVAQPQAVHINSIVGV